MTTPRLYLDHNATSPLRPAVRDVMMEAMEGAHNPSSVHGEGRAAKALLERSRKTLSEVLSVPMEGLVFTSGGTEADNFALRGMVEGEAKVRRLFVSAIEHPAVTAPAKALADTGLVTLERIPVMSAGVIDLAWLAKRMASYDPATEGAFLVAVMLANNETGVLQPVAEIGPLVWPKGGYVFTDAVQGFGKLPLDFGALDADLMAVGAHKVGGPVGVGALCLKPGIPLAPYLRGGGQELSRRAGTENIAAIAGFAQAAREASPTDYDALAGLREAMEEGLPSGTTVWGAGSPRLGNTLCFSAPGFAGEIQVMVMDLGGIAISAGSACSSGKVRPSGVLSAMGAGEDQAMSAVRVSLGWDTPADAATRFLSVWTREYERIAAHAA